MEIIISESRNFDVSQIAPLYQVNHWSSAQKPEVLVKALLNSHNLITAWDQEKLVGLGNAISDGYLVVYYPHLLVLPSYQRLGVGKLIMNKLSEKYTGFHQQILVADSKAIDFYKKCGFESAGDTEAMWIYKGDEHS